MTAPEKSLEEQLAEVQARRAALAASRDKSGLAQQVADELKLLELDEAFPDGFACVRLNAPIAGMPGFVAARDCGKALFKRYQDGVKVRVSGKAAEVDTGDGAAVLARACLIYPDAETFAKMCELRAGLDSGLGQEVVQRAQTRKADEAKK